MARPRQAPRRPAPPPLQTNDVGVAIAGTTAWIIALGVLMVLDLPREDRWWLWVCAVGIAIGLFAIGYVPRLQRNRARDAERHAKKAGRSGTEPEESAESGRLAEPGETETSETETSETETSAASGGSAEPAEPGQAPSAS